MIYEIGDIIKIELDNGTTCMAKLIEIIPKKGKSSKVIWPSIKVQWYYSKEDINRQKNGLKDESLFRYLSKYELFLTNHSDIVYIESVVTKCLIVSFENFVEFEEYDDYSFFSRANYDSRKEKLVPDFLEWKKCSCCGMPPNPDNGVAKCEICSSICHSGCGTFSEKKDEFEEIVATFVCKNCKGKGVPCVLHL